MLIKSANINYIYSYNKDIFEESIFFDIETTGLNPKYSKIVMIGILYFKNGNYTLTQFFSEKDGEKEVIQEFINIMMNFRYLISYNGNSFDLRFIKKRAQFNNLNFSLKNKCLIDLLKVFRIHRNRFNTENLKLKTVEKFSAIDRKDQ
ncbi:MAG: ribonuclease H-like domain-containing protein, partial [Bacillota bacterium]|nr:ribonuclease H-like domain-containing protein [Bacillota bacterium]